MLNAEEVKKVSSIEVIKPTGEINDIPLYNNYVTD